MWFVANLKSGVKPPHSKSFFQQPAKRGEALIPFGWTEVAACKSGNKLPHSKFSLSEVTHNLRADPFSNRYRDPIPDHSVRVRLASHESKCIGDTLESCVFSDRVRSHALRKPSIDHQSGAQVFRVMRNAGRCNVAALRIADDRSISISAGETLEDIVRNVRNRIGFLLKLAPSEVSPAADDA